jgi:glutamate N-acetyltransferase/amino-acid N-acetyltransferase
MLRRVADRTFNCLSVDTDTSTSDTVAVISTGKRKLAAEELPAFENALTAAALKLVKDVAAEAEGATKLIEVTVACASSSEDAHIIAKSIVNSPLLKTAVLGADPNWGRVVMAMGKAKVRSGDSRILPADVTIRMMGLPTFVKGQRVDVGLQSLSQLMRERGRVTVDVQIGEPHFTAKVWGCDLTEQYVLENSQYTT